MRSFAALVALAVLISQSGCGPTVPAWRLPEPPTEELRRSLGRIAVVLEADAAAEFPAPPLAGACSMAAVGALGGLLIGLGVGLVVCSAAPRCLAGDPLTAFVAGAILLLGVAVAAVGAPLGALIGAADGSTKGRPAEEVEAARRILQAAAARAELPPLLQRRILEALRRETRVPIAAEGQADTLLVIGRPRVALAGPIRPDPPLTSFGDVRFQLRRTSDRRVLHEITLGFRGKTRTLDAWIAAEGEFFRTDFLAGTNGFAARVVEELFLLERQAGEPAP